MAADLTSGDVKTMNGEKAKISVSRDKIEIEGNKVFSADVVAKNGILHTIGTVLIPESLEGFAGLDKEKNFELAVVLGTATLQLQS
jgi:uncharacterized surface protein with fasciclin (FAS1) repeats